MITTLDLYIFIEEYSWDDAPHYAVYSSKIGESEDRVFLKQITLELDVPSPDECVPLRVAAFEEAKQNIRALATAKATVLEERKQRLLALEAPNA